MYRNFKAAVVERRGSSLYIGNPPKDYFFYYKFNQSQPSGLKPRCDAYPLTPALRLGLMVALSELGFSPDSLWLIYN